MGIQRETDGFRVELAGEWSLHELHDYSHIFNQVYSMANHLERLRRGQTQPDSWEIDGETLLLGSFPWKGGYSAVNFYNRLRSRIPRRERPRVLQIEYHSPGFLELALYVPAALAISAMVAAFLKNGHQLISLVRYSYKTLRDMDLMRIEAKRKKLELTREQIDFLRDASGDLERLLEIPNAELIDELAPNDLAKLKLELSIYRRVKQLAKYESYGMAKITGKVGREHEDPSGDDEKDGEDE